MTVQTLYITCKIILFTLCIRYTEFPLYILHHILHAWSVVRGRPHTYVPQSHIHNIVLTFEELNFRGWPFFCEIYFSGNESCGSAIQLPPTACKQYVRHFFAVCKFRTLNCKCSSLKNAKVKLLKNFSTRQCTVKPS